MKAYESVKIGTNRGRPRIWLEGMKAILGGFLPGKRFNLIVNAEHKSICLELHNQGERVVSQKLRNDRAIPIIDINSGHALGVFEGHDSVRIVVLESRIFILLSVVERSVQERITRLQRKLEADEPLLVGSLSHGGGVLSHALHKGMADAGVASSLAFANEIRPELVEQAYACNDVWDANTIPLIAPLQEVAFDQAVMSRLPMVELLEAGLPCSGASVAGRAKNGAGHAEAHPEVGHLVVGFLALVAKVQPVAIAFENVLPYRNSASMHLMRNQLRDFGYEVHEIEVNAEDWNVLEHRARLCMVAVTRGIEFNFDLLEKPPRVERHLGEILEPISESDPCWSPMTGLKEKEIRDKAEGKNFKMQIVTPFSTSCPTITKGYSKIRSTDAKLQHPSNPALLRQFTASEHARIKGIPEALVSGVSSTLAHEILGQSICYEPFRAIGKCIGGYLGRIKLMEPKETAFQLVG